jgi:hypothetical protein
VGPRPVAVGLLGTSDRARELTEELAEGLPEELGERIPDVQWCVETAGGPPEDQVAHGRELMEATRRLLLRKQWRVAVCLTDLPLRSDRRPVVAQASATEGVVLVSLPALGAVGVERRAREAVIGLVEGVVGSGARELATPIAHAHVRDDGTVRLASAIVRGNLRLLAGMVRANDPWRVVARMSRALTAALGTSAFALASSNIWQLADGTSWSRLVALAVLSVLATCAALVVAHGLWERSRRPEERERVMLFNLATTATVVLGVIVLYLALLLVTLVCAGALIPLGVFDSQLGHSVGPVDYLRLSLLVTSLGTIGGALGSMVESDFAVRDAIYRGHGRGPDESEVGTEESEVRPG